MTPFDPSAPVQVHVDAPSPRKSSRADSSYDMDHFESFAGPNTSESEFISTIYDLLKAGADVYAVVDRQGKYDRLRGVWVNRDKSEVTTKHLLQQLGAR